MSDYQGTACLQRLQVSRLALQAPCRLAVVGDWEAFARLRSGCIPLYLHRGTTNHAE